MLVNILMEWAMEFSWRVNAFNNSIVLMAIDGGYVGTIYIDKHATVVTAFNSRHDSNMNLCVADPKFFDKLEIYLVGKV